MKTEILKIKGDWQEVVDDCRATVKKSPLGKEPSTDFKKAILLAEHEPIRRIEIKFRWRGIPYWIAMHWKTHIWPGRVDSQRNDRQSRYNREKAPQDAPVDFIGDPNTQHLIDTMRKRLCRMASPETRGYAEDLKRTTHDIEELREVSEVMVPNCVYRCGCPEPNTCGLWQAWMKKTGGRIGTSYIQDRYDVYNGLFYKEDEKC